MVSKDLNSDPNVCTLSALKAVTSFQHRAACFSFSSVPLCLACILFPPLSKRTGPSYFIVAAPCSNCTNASIYPSFQLYMIPCLFFNALQSDLIPPRCMGAECPVQRTARAQRNDLKEMNLNRTSRYHITIQHMEGSVCREAKLLGQKMSSFHSCLCSENKGLWLPHIDGYKLRGFWKDGIRERGKKKRT